VKHRLYLREGRPRDIDVGVCDIRGRLGRLNVLLGREAVLLEHELSGVEFLVELGRRLDALELRLGLQVVGACVVERGLVEDGIDLRDDLPLLHLGVVVDEELRDTPAHLRAHLHRDGGE
jgi:hypothetical protein